MVQSNSLDEYIMLEKLFKNIQATFAAAKYLWEMNPFRKL